MFQCHELGVTGIGAMPADIVAVGIAPGKNEWEVTKRPFTGPSGQMLNNLFKFVGINRDDVFTTNLLCWWKDSPTPAEIDICQVRFLAEIAAAQPKVVLLLGKIVTEYILHKPFGKVLHGAFWHESFDAWCISTYHPSAYIRQGGDFQADIADAVRDFRKIAIYLDAPKDFGKVNYTVAQSVDEANAYLKHFANHKDIVAIDVETEYPPNEGMISIAFSCNHHTIHFPRGLVNLPNYNLLQGSLAVWTFQNGMFDVSMIRKYLGIDLRIYEDTMLQDYSLDERGGKDQEVDSAGYSRSVGVHGLKRMAMEYCGAELYGEKIKGKIDQAGVVVIHSKESIEDDEDEVEESVPITEEDLALYNSSDAEYTRRIAERNIPLQIADGVRDMYLQLLIPAANALAEIHDRGAYIDMLALNELAMEWLPQWLDLDQAIQDEAHELGWPEDSILNIRSWPQLQKFVYDICKAPTIGRGNMARSTSKPIVELMVKNYPDHPASKWLSTLIRWRGIDRDVNTYIKGIQAGVDSNGYIHPEPIIHGTRNGRLAYHKPPINTIPKARTVGEDRARIRRLFSVESDDRILLEADYRQAELWHSAFVSGDQTMLEDLSRCVKCGQLTHLDKGSMVDINNQAICPVVVDDNLLHASDFHARVAESNWNRSKADCNPIEWDFLRDSAKRLVYGINYGAGPNALVEEKKLGGAQGSVYRFLDTMEQARAAIDNYLTRYARYKAWRQNEQRIVQTEGEQISLAGRKRRYFMINNYNQLNQAINTPIASISHDFLLASLIELHYALKPFNGFVLWDIHDAILFDLSKSTIHESVMLITDIMTKPRWGSPTGVPIDIKVGPNWFDMISLEKYYRANAKEAPTITHT